MLFRSDYERLQELESCVGKGRLVLDLSCKKKQAGYVVVTDRWQKETTEYINDKLLDELSAYCEEFLIHGVDVEGKSQGIEEELVSLLGKWGKKTITYAGGVHDFTDLKQLKELGRGKVNVTIGSALDIFGGTMPFHKVVEYCNKERVEK